MATIKLNRSAFFNTAIYFGDDLGHAFSYGEPFEQPVLIEKMNGDTESIKSLINLEGELATSKCSENRLLNMPSYESRLPPRRLMLKSLLLHLRWNCCLPNIICLK